jgi:hypothetical protein
MPNFHQNMVWPFLLMIVLLLAFAVGQRRPIWGVLSARLSVPGFVGHRNIALFALVVSPDWRPN